jgi:hypothetical protein
MRWLDKLKSKPSEKEARRRTDATLALLVIEL